MSTAVESNPPGEAKPEGLSKYIKRMRTVFRRSSTAKSGSGAASNMEGKAESREAEQIAGPTAAAAPKPTPATTTTPAPKPTTIATSPADQPIVVSHWSAIQEARTRALFAKHGLSLADDDDWKPTDTSVERVAKPIRMRVRRSCHRCQTPFGSDRVCVNCQHTRCKSCPRHPSPRRKEDPETAFRNLMAQKGKGVAGNAPVPQQQHGNPSRPKQINDGNRNEYVLRIPSRTGGQDLVRKPVMQRVRRTCHRCDKLFVAGSKQCSGCDHVRCKKCPRDPPKPDKYPEGYPGDVEPPVELPPRTWKKVRRRVRPKRVKPEPDPEIFKKVEERLASLRLATE
ncbi:uncharacterized protein KD926_009696 [Aspergillus affinis]|uniref:uncharacterized protein n=1 Tax=Aspergillus affinis TaxID=1070780 RepID=UPI0022FE41EE|nr:uncharacterized protein KD926_009696 [Aspergillus affinis]KAI9045282.1 hypothetical protein KD926_009696 [Aspergillus affinis]